MKVLRIPYETIEDMLRRFKKGTSKANLIGDMKRHEHYEKPSVRRKKKSAAARERALKEKKKNG